MWTLWLCFWEEGVKAGCFDPLPFPSYPTGLACGLISLSTGVARRKKSFFCNTLSKISLGKDCCSVTQLCPTLCKPMNCSTPGFPALTISQSLLKLMSAESVMHPTISSSVTPFSSCPLSFPASGSFLPVANRTRNLQDVASLFIRGFLLPASSTSLS